MRMYFLTATLIFILVGIGTLFSRSLGWYNNYWYTDVILHFISGVSFGLIWLGLNHKLENKSFLVLFIGCISFAVFGSVLWEFWEYAGWHITPSHTQFYIPELGDTLSDIFCGLLGGSVVGLIYFFMSGRTKVL